jgi:hypothetical protein
MVDLRLVGLQSAKHFDVIGITDERFCLRHGGWFVLFDLLVVVAFAPRKEKRI